MCVCVCVCLRVCCHPQRVLLYHNSSLRLDMPIAFSWDRNLPNFTLDSVSYHLTNLATHVSLGIITNFVLAFVCLYFALPDTVVLNSLEELCITRVAAINCFTRVLNPQEGSVYVFILMICFIYTYLYIYIYIYIYIYMSLFWFNKMKELF